MKSINSGFDVFETEAVRFFRETSSRSKISPLRLREGWEFSLSLLDTPVIGIAFVGDKA